MPQFTKKPLTIEAMQLVGNEADLHAVYQWVEANTQGSFDPYAEEVPASGVSIDPETGFMLIATLEGVMQAKPGDYIIRGVNGEFYPCKPDIFAKTYDQVDEAKTLRDLETKRALLQTVVEASRGNQLLDQQLKHGQFHSARGTLATMRQITKLQDDLIPKVIRG